MKPDQRTFSKIHLISALAGGLLVALLGSFQLVPEGTPRPALTENPPATALERQIGQLIMVGFTGTSEKDTGVQAVASQLASGRIGGVMLLGRNIRTQDQLARLTRHLAAQSPAVPALVAVDQEGGQVQRLAPLGDAFTWMAAQDLPAATGNCSPEAVQAYYGSRAAQLAALGINLNFGPVVDLNLRPESPAIGRLKRSFSADPRLVTACAEGFLKAHTAAGVATALKHFPGHGSADADSHHRLPVIDGVWQESELLPYRDLAERGRVDMVMMGHVVHRRFSDRPDLPASVSGKGVAEARAVLGEQTILITDDLEMRAVARRFPPEEAAVQALAAGNDMILVSSYGRSDPGLGDRLNAAIVSAVMDGRISTAKIGSAVGRVSAFKQRLASPRS